MDIRSLEYLLAPGRIAVLGADSAAGTAGRLLLNNLTGSGFRGSIFPVHPSKEAILGIPAYPDVRDIPKEVDLAVLCGSPKTILEDLEACGEKGVRAVLILAHDFRHRVKAPKKFIKAIKQKGLKHKIRILGPNSMGFIRPKLSLNVSTAQVTPPPGRLAFISQSTTLAASILDYASSKNVGFSAFLSLGTLVDVDFADLMDFFGIDQATRGMILYIESVKDGRKFMSAARAFARAKPIVVVKGGRYAQSAQAALTHTGVLAGEDKVYDAIFKRAGMIRVEEVLELFHISEALSKQPAPKGNKLLIVTSAGGPAIMATDTLNRYGGELAPLSPEAKRALDAVLPEHWNPENPLDVLSDASAHRFRDVVSICLKEEEPDGVLVILTPQFSSEPVATAKMLVELANKNPKKTLLACWMGTGESAKGRQILNLGGIPTFVAPEQAVKSFVYMHNYDKNIKLLYETPANIQEDFHPDSEAVEAILSRAGKEGQLLLSERESKEVLRAYNIESPPVKLATTPDEALEIARKMGFPVALKVESPDIPHKSEVGGVILHVTESQVKETFKRIKSNVMSMKPEARFLGVTVQPMVLWPGHEVAIGAKKDPTFGSVILFGTGGDLFETLEDYAVGLPPLNQTLARRLMEETKIYRYLKGKAFPRVDIEGLERILINFSQLIVDFPQIREVDINPFYVGGDQGVCLDARIVLEKDAHSGVKRAQGPCCPSNLAICPYPCHYMDTASLKDGRPYIIRPIRPEDEPLLLELFHTFSPETIYMRFFQPLTDIPHEQLVRYCQVDYTRDIALVASIHEENRERIIGVGRLTMLPNGQDAEMAIVVGDPWQRQGVGLQLAKHCLAIARSEGRQVIIMDVLRQNDAMKGLAQKLGFEQVPSDDDDIVRFRLDLYKRGKGKHRA